MINLSLILEYTIDRIVSNKIIIKLKLENMNENLQML